MTPRERAALAARIAAYGKAVKRTPAEYTLREALVAYGKEKAAQAKVKGDKKGSIQTAETDSDE